MRSSHTRRGATAAVPLMAVPGEYPVPAMATIAQKRVI
jgi:hypothetical protein